MVKSCHPSAPKAGRALTETGPSVLSPSLAGSYQNAARSNGKRLPPTTGYSPKGSRPPYMDPGVQVADQKPPSSGRPVRQHYQFASEGRK